MSLKNAKKYHVKERLELSLSDGDSNNKEEAATGLDSSFKRPSFFQYECQPDIRTKCTAST